MEYIKLDKAKLTLECSSDNMSNLWGFIKNSLYFTNIYKAEILDSMKRDQQYIIGSNSTEEIKIIAPNKAILYDLGDISSKIELPFDSLCKLSEKYFEIDDDKIKELLITYDPKTEVFEMSIKYTDNKEEHFKFESEYKEINKTKR